MNHSVRELCEQFATHIINSQNTEGEFQSIDGVENYHDRSLIFVAEQPQVPDFTVAKPAVLVTSAGLAQELDDDELCVIVVRDVKLAQAYIKQHYDDFDCTDPDWEDIHPSAIIHPSVKLGKGVRVGANSVVGKNTVIGDNSIIRANCVVEHDVTIGSDTTVHNLANIGYGCVLGSRVIIRPGVIVGNEGFGFAKDDKHHYQRVPHTGTVEIQDDVQIGSNCNIDRGTYGKTIIARGVKIDALCHVAHNVLVDEDALFVAQTGVAGSSNIGKRAILSGQTGVIDHMNIADDAVLVHRCGVTEDIPTAGVWAGTPPKPFREYVRNLSLDKKIEKILKRISAIESRD